MQCSMGTCNALGIFISTTIGASHTRHRDNNAHYIADDRNKKTICNKQKIREKEIKAKKKWIPDSAFSNDLQQIVENDNKNQIFSVYDFIAL